VSSAARLIRHGAQIVRQTDAKIDEAADDGAAAEA
jgi:hypothetical protein